MTSTGARAGASLCDEPVDLAAHAARGVADLVDLDELIAVDERRRELLAMGQDQRERHAQVVCDLGDSLISCAGFPPGTEHSVPPEIC